MSPRTQVLVAVLLACLVCGTASSYTRPRWFVDPDIVHPRWPTDIVIPFAVNTSEPNRIVAGSKPFLAVRNMFERRSAYTPLRFAPVEQTLHEDFGIDGTNLVTFKDTPENRSASFGFGAVTNYFWNWVDGEPQLIETDIVFNPTVAFSTAGSGGVDIENLGGHELIHLMACDHSGVIGSTAFPNDYTAVPDERNLAADDLAAQNFLYPFPETANETGSLGGTIVKSGDLPVFGAHVVAQRVADGAPISDISVWGGEWRIDGLSPGEYTIFIEPLDGPSEPGNTLFGGIYQDAVVDVDFRTKFIGGFNSPTVYDVRAGEHTVVGSLAASNSAGFLNLRRLGLNDVAQPVIGASAVNVYQGQSAYLTLQGPGVNQVLDDAVSISGTGVHLSTTGIVRGVQPFDPYMVVPITVDLDAPPGTRSIFVKGGPQRAALTGAIEVHPSSPYPSLLRNDELTSVAQVGAALTGLFPLDPLGADGFPGTGEGVLREDPGSDDDDDLYAPEIESGFVDPDLEVLSDESRPLVFYRLDDASRTLYLDISESGRIVVTYSDPP